MRAPLSIHRYGPQAEIYTIYNKCISVAGFNLFQTPLEEVLCPGHVWIEC
jgi:hypothetical protein